jgi:hypothetical protein
MLLTMTQVRDEVAGVVITNERRECGDLKMLLQRHEIAALSSQ